MAIRRQQSFGELYRGKDRVFSFEFFPPKQEEDLPATKEMIARLARLEPDFMTVTYGAGGGSRDRTRELVSYIVNELACPAAAHLTCVHHTVAEINELLDGLAAEGVRHIVALRGDPQNHHDPGKEMFPGFKCARDLVGHIAARGEFSIAVAGYPEMHPDAISPEAEIAYLGEKIAAGGEIVLTQLFFEPSVYFSYVTRVRAAGIAAPVVPGVLPVASAKQLRNITSKCAATVPPALLSALDACGGDAEAERQLGTKHAIELCRALLDGGAPGIHFYTLNKSFQVEEVLSALRA